MLSKNKAYHKRSGYPSEPNSSDKNYLWYPMLVKSAEFKQLAAQRWDAVKGADKYEIWRATSSNGTYTKMYTTSSLYYTNTYGEGDFVELAGLSFKVLHTPGHTKGGVCFYDRENGVLFSGDTLFLLKTSSETGFESFLYTTLILCSSNEYSCPPLGKAKKPPMSSQFPQ